MLSLGTDGKVHPQFVEHAVANISKQILAGHQLPIIPKLYSFRLVPAGKSQMLGIPAIQGPANISALQALWMVTRLRVFCDPKNSRPNILTIFRFGTLLRPSTFGGLLLEKQVG